MTTTYTVVYVSDNVIGGNEPIGHEFQFDGEPGQHMLEIMFEQEGILDADSVSLIGIERRRRGWYIDFQAVGEDGDQFAGRFAVALKADVDCLGNDDIDSDVLFGE